MRFLASLALVLNVATCVEARSQDGQGQVPQTGHMCEPWPACAITKSPLIPGAPSPGLRPQGQPSSENIFSGDALTKQRIDRGTFRLPEVK
jgi:hypothetical protein